MPPFPPGHRGNLRAHWHPWPCALLQSLAPPRMAQCPCLSFQTFSFFEYYLYFNLVFLFFVWFQPCPPPIVCPLRPKATLLCSIQFAPAPGQRQRRRCVYARPCRGNFLQFLIPFVFYTKTIPFVFSLHRKYPHPPGHSPPHPDCSPHNTAPPAARGCTPGVPPPPRPPPVRPCTPPSTNCLLTFIVISDLVL